jgi:hypothetical protein
VKPWTVDLPPASHPSQPQRPRPQMVLPVAEETTWYWTLIVPFSVEC